MKNKIINIFSLVLCVYFLQSCSAIDKQIEHGKLEVTTKMSDSIFLDPVSSDKMTVLVKIRNTSDYDVSGITENIISSLTAKGYKIVHNPDDAYYILQANILQVGLAKDPNNPLAALSSGYGASIGAIAAISSSRNARLGDVATGSLIGGAVEYMVDKAVKVHCYSITTDIQISEKSAPMEVAVKSTSKQGKNSSKVKYSEQTDRKKYQTRIISFAKKTNLKFEDAESVISDGLVKSISGMF